MSSMLPDYEPPHARRAGLAAGVAPLAVLALFVLVVLHWLDVTSAGAWLLGLCAWVTHEMSAWQRALDRYNLHYARRHLHWRSSDALLALVDSPEVTDPTRHFVRRYVSAERRVLPDGQLP
jgi:hypothetical protein